ncbi:MAG: L,D-transpeptidase [Saprospiraceae bacterium]|nr:L,D-transpeptidase [Saprospiraceae bacterium]
MKNYFKYIDNLAKKYSDSLHFDLTEYELVNYNPDLIDSLAATDYYSLTSRGIIDVNQRERVILPAGTILFIPGKPEAITVRNNLSRNRIIINIPEYKMRIFNDNLLIYSTSVRVGRNESKYLPSINKYSDLRTRTGKGVVYRTEQNPTWINSVEGKKYTETRRDDNFVTKMPISPSLILKMHGIISGQLIHATTNLETLEKAYSNGSVGTRESDMWYIYYYAPPGTRVDILYDLNVPDLEGNPLNDIYNQANHRIN